MSINEALRQERIVEYCRKLESRDAVISKSMEFTGHKSDCDWLQPNWHKGPCDCGYSDLLPELVAFGLKKWPYQFKHVDGRVGFGESAHQATSQVVEDVRYLDSTGRIIVKDINGQLIGEVIYVDD